MKIKIFVLSLLMLYVGASHAFDNYDQAFNQMRCRYSLGHYKRMLAIAPVTLKFCTSPGQKYNVLYYKALAFYELQYFWQAEQTFAEAARLGDISEKQKLQAVYNQIRSQYANKHFISALANAEKYSVFSGKPSALQLNILLIGIETARQLDRNVKALDLAEKMEKAADPDSAWHYRGIIMQIQILCLTKEYEKAEKIISKVDITKVPLPMQSEFLAWSGYCCEKGDKPGIAAEKYSLAYADSASYYAGLAALRHANMRNRNGEKDYEKTASIYEKVMQMSGAHPDHKSQAVYKIARLYEQHQQPDIAEHLLAGIDKVGSPSVYWLAKIYNLRGDILYKKGDMDRARKYFKLCVSLSPQQPDTNYAKEILAQIGEKTVLPEKK
ncbi:MAG: tetratricopeptide repeat protein [Victivallaceae bacterium]|nr:tetratricopeptide repeat protein [Victivallaceae bacterium]